MRSYNNIDEYINGYPKQIQAILKKLRDEIARVVQGATETIAYGIPTFKYHGKNLVHFAAFADHISFFPTGSGIEAFRKELGDHVSGKGTAQFALTEEIPYELIRRIVEYRKAQVDKTV